MLTGRFFAELQDNGLLEVGFRFGIIPHDPHVVDAVQRRDAADAAGDELRRQEFRLEERERRRHLVREEKRRQDVIHLRAVGQQLQRIQEDAHPQGVVEGDQENGKIFLVRHAARRHLVLDVADGKRFGLLGGQVAKGSDRRQSFRRLLQQLLHQALAIVVRLLHHDDGVLARQQGQQVLAHQARVAHAVTREVLGFVVQPVLFRAFVVVASCGQAGGARAAITASSKLAKASNTRRPTDRFGVDCSGTKRKRPFL